MFLNRFKLGPSLGVIRTTVSQAPWCDGPMEGNKKYQAPIPDVDNGREEHIAGD
jgi:hypothetical protein